MTRAHLLSIRFADGAYGIRDSSVGGMVPKMNAHAGPSVATLGATMRQASKRVPDSAEKTVRDIRRATRRHFLD
jgi:hypothetical protein